MKNVLAIKEKEVETSFSQCFCFQPLMVVQVSTGLCLFVCLCVDLFDVKDDNGRKAMKVIWENLPFASILPTKPLKVVQVSCAQKL